jgi:hypothetical protein
MQSEENGSRNYYSLPKAEHVPSSSLRPNLGIKSGISSESGLQIVLYEDLARVALFDEIQFSWQVLCVEIANGLVSGAAGWVASAALSRINPSNAGLSKRALTEIREIVREEIDSAFLEHYLREVDGISNALMTYRETKEERKLNEAEGKSDSLLPHLKSFGAKGLGGFVMAANLHLTAVLAKAETIVGYRDTYNRLRLGYATHAIDQANEIRRQLFDISPVTCETTGSSWTGKCFKCSFSNRGRRDGASVCYEGRPDPRSLALPSSDETRVRNEANGKREGAWRQATAETQTLVNPVVEAANKWAS